MEHTILIIEDEFIIANQIKVFLETEGYRVIGPSDDYETSILLIDDNQPDLIVADIRLGKDTDAGIRISQYVSKKYFIPVVFLSGYSDIKTIEKAKSTSPNTFLIKPKPLDKDQLLATIRIALPDASPSSKFKNLTLKGRELNLNHPKVHEELHGKSNYLIKSIEIHSITHIESYNHFFKNTVLLHFENSEVCFLVRSEMEELQRKLPPIFLRVHKSFLVNKNKINSRKSNDLLFIGNQQIPIGEAYAKNVEFSVSDL